MSSALRIAAYSAPGSPFVFNYLDKELFDTPRGLERLTKILVARVGEPFTFGWLPAELPAWLEARGFDVEWNKRLGALADELLLNSKARDWMREHGRYTLLARRADAKPAAADAKPADTKASASAAKPAPAAAPAAAAPASAPKKSPL